MFWVATKVMQESSMGVHLGFVRILLDGCYGALGDIFYTFYDMTKKN